MIICSCFNLNEKELKSIPEEDLYQSVKCGKCIEDRHFINEELSPEFNKS